MPFQHTLHLRHSLVRIALPGLLTLSPLMLAGCSAAQENQEQASTSSGCNASRADHVIGQYASGYYERVAMRDAGAKAVRTLAPDTAATMDFNPTRLNIHTDPGNVIIKLACG